MIETGHNVTASGTALRARLSRQRAAGLLDVTRAALEDALTLAAGHDETAGQVQSLLDDLGQPLKVAVAGQVSAGKSTLVNAIVGERVAETGKAETTQVNWWFRYGAEPGMVFRRRAAAPLRVPLDGAFVPPDLDLDVIDPITVLLPKPLLEKLTLIDSPGLSSPNEDRSERAVRLMADQTTAAAEQADALVYVSQEVPGGARADEHLKMFQRLFSNFGERSPTNAVYVLTQVDRGWDYEDDEGRSPLDTAARLLGNHAADLWRRVWDSRPVVGHLAELSLADGALLEPAELDAIRALARHADWDELLVSVGELRAAGVAEVEPAARERLWRRLGGQYGLRLCLTLAASDASDDEILSGIREASGIDAVLALVDDLFRRRSELVRSDLALRRLERVALARTGRLPGEVAARVLERVERVRESATGKEVRRLDVLRLVCAPPDGQLRLSDDRRREVRSLLGEDTAAARLDMPAPTPTAELIVIAAERRRWWRAQEGQTPITPQMRRVAAETSLAYQQLARDLERNLVSMEG